MIINLSQIDYWANTIDLPSISYIWYYVLLLFVITVTDLPGLSNVYISCILAIFSCLHHLSYRNGLRCISLILYINHLQFKGDVMESCSPWHCFTKHIQAGLTKLGKVGEILALYQLQSEIKVALFLFACCSFLANNLRFMVKLIDKAIVINVKIHKNERKRLYSSNKENLTYWDKRMMAIV